MPVRTTWLSARALRLHAALVVVVGACLALGWWQLSRALGGNALSWVYTFEWPFFALYACYMWWKLIHEPLAETRAAERAAAKARRIEAARRIATQHSVVEQLDHLGFDPYDDADPELAAYNRYLASLHERDAERRRPAGRRSPADT